MVCATAGTTVCRRASSPAHQAMHQVMRRDACVGALGRHQPCAAVYAPCQRQGCCEPRMAAQSPMPHGPRAAPHGRSLGTRRMGAPAPPSWPYPLYFRGSLVPGVPCSRVRDARVNASRRPIRVLNSSLGVLNSPVFRPFSTKSVLNSAWRPKLNKLGACDVEGLSRYCRHGRRELGGAAGGAHVLSTPVPEFADLTRSPSRRATTAIHAMRTAGVDVLRT